MEINSKDELLSVIEDLQSRLAVVEDSSSKKEPEQEPEEPKQEESSEETKEVESEDEIEKLLNA
jgi:hypothetical protein